MSCLSFSDIERPSAEELLQSNFLNDLDNDENNHLIQLNTKEFKDYEITISTDNVLTNMRSPFKNGSIKSRAKDSPFKSSPYKGSPKISKKKQKHWRQKSNSIDLLQLMDVQNYLISEFYLETEQMRKELECNENKKKRASCSIKCVNFINKIEDEFNLTPKKSMKSNKSTQNVHTTKKVSNIKNVLHKNIYLSPSKQIQSNSNSDSGQNQNLITPKCPLKTKHSCFKANEPIADSPEINNEENNRISIYNVDEGNTPGHQSGKTANNEQHKHHSNFDLYDSDSSDIESTSEKRKSSKINNPDCLTHISNQNKQIVQSNPALNQFNNPLNKKSSNEQERKHSSKNSKLNKEPRQRESRNIDFSQNSSSNISNSPTRKKSSGFNLNIEEQEGQVNQTDQIVISLLKNNTSTKNSASKILKIKFDYNLQSDTCEGIVSELKSAIDLTNEEVNELQQLLKELIYRHKRNLRKSSKPGYKVNFSEEKDIQYYNKDTIDDNKVIVEDKIIENSNEDENKEQLVKEYEKYINEGRALFEKMKVSSSKKGCSNIDKMLRKLNLFLQNDDL